MIDYTEAALTYSLLILPAMFSLAVIGQGIYKLKKGDKTGRVILGFGLFFLILIPAAYFFFIRI